MRYRPILVASHPRSGTHAVIDFIRKTFPSTRSWRLWGLPLNHLYVNIESLTLQESRVNKRLAEWSASRKFNRPDRALLKTHFLPDFSETWVEEQSGPLGASWREIIDEAHLVYVTRDPRAVMRSYKTFMSQFEPAYGEMSLVEFCQTAHWTGKMDRLDWWSRHVSEWLAVENVIHVRLERLLSDPAAVATRLSDALEERPVLSKDPLPKPFRSVWEARLSRLTSLAPESTTVLPELKEGAKAKQADPDELRFFDERLAGRPGHLLTRRGSV